MRIFPALIAVVLLLLAIVGFGVGIWLIYEALHAPGQTNALGLFGALAFALPGFLIGTVALVGVGVMLMIDQAREENRFMLESSVAAQREQLGIQQHIQARMIAARIGDQR
jgi:hypothetical protein